MDITHHKLEQNFYDLGQKYNEMFMSSIIQEKTSVESQKNSNVDDYIDLSIQLSEIKGKLETKEQTLLIVRYEKDRIYLELSKKNLMLTQENDE